MSPCSQVNGNGIQASCLAWGEGFGGPWGGLPERDVPSSPTYSQHSCYCGLQGPCWPFSSSRTKQGKRAMNQDLPRGDPDTTRQKTEAWACRSRKPGPAAARRCFRSGFGRWGSQISALPGCPCRPPPSTPGSQCVSTPPSPQPPHFRLPSKDGSRKDSVMKSLRCN